MKNQKYICANCGSSDIEAKAWVKINEDNKFSSFYDETLREGADIWCNECVDTSTLKIVEE